jgi:hypothetical protein
MPQRPVLLPDVPQRFIPVRGSQPAGAALHYQPMLVGAAQLRFADAKRGADMTRDVVLCTPITADAVPIGWDRAVDAPFAVGDLEPGPAGGAAFGELPGAATKPRSYEDWRKDLAGWLHRSQALELFVSPSTRTVSRPGESERDFRIRLGETARAGRDEAIQALRQKYAPKIAALQERLRRAEQTVERETAQVTQQGLQTAISVGATILGAFLGRKAVSASTVGRATTAMRGAGRVLKERQDIGRARESAEAVRQQLADLEGQVQAEIEALGAKADHLTETLETLVVRPSRANISVTLVTLAWAPCWSDASGHLTPAWA